MLKAPNLNTLDCVLVLSLQRSGSSLVCKDISNLGIGNPGEYFLNVRRDYKNEVLVKNFWDASVDERFFAIKVMDNYLDDFLGFMIKDTPKFRKEEDIVPYRTRALDKLASSFKSLTIVHIHRNSAFEQAFSQYRATKTMKYHSYWDGEELDMSEKFNPAMLASILHEHACYRRRLGATLSRFRGKIFKFVYEDVLNTRETYLKGLCSHLGVEHKYIEDTTFQKVAQSNEVQWAREEFDKYLSSESSTPPVNST